MTVQTKEVMFFSPEWAEEVKRCFNDPPPPDYRATKLDMYWEWITNARADFDGALALGVTGLGGTDAPVYVLLPFSGGRCGGMSFGGPLDAQQATFVLSASLSAWKDVVDGYDASRALMERKIRLESGDPYAFYKRVFFFTEALSAIARIPTAFPNGKQT